MPPISQNSKVALTIGTIITCSLALIGATWQVAITLSDIRGELIAIRRDMRQSWSVQSQERWAVQLERQNRALGVTVPEVRDYAN